MEVGAKVSVNGNHHSTMGKISYRSI